MPKLYASDFAELMKANQKLLMELVSGITGHTSPNTVETADEGEDILTTMAHDNGLELIEAD